LGDSSCTADEDVFLGRDASLVSNLIFWHWTVHTEKPHYRHIKILIFSSTDLTSGSSVVLCRTGNVTKGRTVFLCYV